MPVAAAGASIVVTSVRPRGAGPFPVARPEPWHRDHLAASRAIGRYRPLHSVPVREWVRRGYAVLVPVRRGYGASGGEHLGDAYGTCERPDFRRAGEGAAFRPTRDHRMGEGARRSRREALAAGRPERRRLRFHLYRLEAPRRTGRRARLLARSRGRSRQAPGRALRIGSLGRALTRRSHRGSRCRCCGSMPRTTSSSAHGCRGSGSRASAPPAAAASSRWCRRFRKPGATGCFRRPRGFPLWTATVTSFIRAQGLDLPFHDR